MKLLEEWPLYEKRLKKDDRVGVYGASDTGKTYMAEHLHLDDREVFVVTLTPDTPAAELRGHWIPKGSDFEFMYGPGAKAILAEKGARLVINELGNAGPDVMSYLYVQTDSFESIQLTLPNGEMLQPKSVKYQVVVTMNSNPRELPDAMMNRFRWQEIKTINPAALLCIPEDLREPAKALAAETNGERRVGIRTWIAFAKLREDPDLSMADAAQMVFGNRAEELINAFKFDEKKTHSIPSEEAKVYPEFHNMTLFNSLEPDGLDMCTRCGEQFGDHLPGVYEITKMTYCKDTLQYAGLKKFNKIQPESGDLCNSCGQDWGEHSDLDCN